MYPYLRVSGQVTDALGPGFVPGKVVLGCEPLSAGGADEWPVVGVDPHLVSVHLPLAHGDVAADVAAVLLGGPVIPLGGESMVDS